MEETRWGKHPRGLYVLFMIEMWERFSFYTMFAIFVFYMDECLHLPSGQLHNTYAFYNGFVYFTPLLGGWLADRYLGCRKAVLIGALCMAAAHYMLASTLYALFYPALLFLVLGNGMFKPNISTMVGNLYPKESALRDPAFNIFYMGINVGAFLGPLVAGFLRTHYGFGWAFAAAGTGMVLSTWILLGFNRHIAHADRTPNDREMNLDEHVMERKAERERILALYLVFAIVIIFWTGYMQYGDVLNFWARDYTTPLFGKYAVPPEWYQVLNPVFIILLTPVIVWFWGVLHRHRREPSTGMKMLWGMVLTGLSFLIMVYAAILQEKSGYGVSGLWLTGFYLVITLAELCLSPMGLSFVTRMAPASLRSTMMGLWFVASGIGGYLSGFIALLWDNPKVSHTMYFLGTAIASFIAVGLMAAGLRFIDRAEKALQAD